MIEKESAVPKESLFRREVFEPVLSSPCGIDDLTLCVWDVHKTHQIKTCYGDVYKTVCALMDYARLLDLVCEQWNLQGFQRASYQLRAKKLREIAEKYQAGIGYDYKAALKKCRKRKRRSNDVGEDALVLVCRKGQEKDNMK